MLNITKKEDKIISSDGTAQASESYETVASEVILVFIIWVCSWIQCWVSFAVLSCYVGISVWTYICLNLLFFHNHLLG